ncbi:hypothetical protein K461DRAFT_157040 [Myriangium duriaei CBS 260.36]|uniref:Uncharacterized protein n=1 Tax=Myriangium duriaei CBS 260.36 TaxID=1168546 RepID=A0A9P4J3K6_9PEZI|nr:hypothetical protein K461DRAFT_157040 [Myriangium duriaei CBS 260.36]
MQQVHRLKRSAKKAGHDSSDPSAHFSHQHAQHTSTGLAPLLFGAPRATFISFPSSLHFQLSLQSSVLLIPHASNVSSRSSIFISHPTPPADIQPALPPSTGMLIRQAKRADQKQQPQRKVNADVCRRKKRGHVVELSANRAKAKSEQRAVCGVGLLSGVKVQRKRQPPEF